MLDPADVGEIADSSTPCGPAPGPPSTGWRRATTSDPRPRSTRCSWPPPNRRSSISSATAWADSWWVMTTWPAGGGVASSSTPGPPPSTAVRRRSSGTSSPGVCSTSERTADGGGRSRTLRAEHPPCHRDLLRPSPRSGPRRARVARGSPKTRGAAISSLFELQGRANTSCSMLDAVLGSALGLTTGLIAGVVLPAFGERRPPGEIAGGNLVVRGLGAAHWSTGPPPMSSPGRGAPSAPSRWRPASSSFGRSGVWTPPRAWSRWSPRESPSRQRVTSEVMHGYERWHCAQLAVGHELVGAARAMLELARAHALDRIQFGQPIGRFQAVRHRLADTLVAVEAADAALDAAWEDRSPQAAAMAKALAGRAARTAARHCQQVLAGIGFTTEHDLHRYVRRVLVLDQLVGAGRTLTAGARRTSCSPAGSSRPCRPSDGRVARRMAGRPAAAHTIRRTSERRGEGGEQPTGSLGGRDQLVTALADRHHPDGEVGHTGIGQRPAGVSGWSTRLPPPGCHRRSARRRARAVLIVRRDLRLGEDPVGPGHRGVDLVVGAQADGDAGNDPGAGRPADSAARVRLGTMYEPMARSSAIHRMVPSARSPHSSSMRGRARPSERGSA